MKAPHLWIRDQFYSEPSRAVAYLNLAFGLTVGLLGRSYGLGVAAALLGAHIWDRFSPGMVISDLRLGPVTLQVPKQSGSTEKRVWLTFDDGPGPETNAVLDILEQYGVPATFFLIGEQVAQWEDLAALSERFERGGHRVGNHSWSHPSFLKLGPEQSWPELERTDRLLREAFPQVWLPIFRPPFGYRTSTLFDQLDDLSLQTVGWSLNSLDFLSGTGEELSERVLREVKANSVVLFHDGPKERGRTVAALPRILNELESRGYTVCVPRAEDFQV